MDIEIREEYKGYKSPVNVVDAIRRMLTATPPQYLAGLAAVVLRNQSSVNKKKRRIRFRGRKIDLAQCAGLYHQQFKDDSRLDRIVRRHNFPSGMPLWFLRRNLVHDIYLSEALFHEIGHHIDYTIGGKRQHRETAAEKWRKQLSRHYAIRRYWYLRPFTKVMLMLIRSMKWILSLFKEL